MGLVAYVGILEQNRVKLSNRAHECVFIGYEIQNKVCMFYDMNVEVTIGSNDGDIHETRFPFNNVKVGAPYLVTLPRP